MLVMIHSIQELRFGQLMTVYEESNLENGREFYPHLPENQQILNAEQDFYQYLKECFFQTEGAVYALWQEKGTYVSALRIEPYQDGFLLAALETAPSCRKKGYATALIRAVLELSWITKVYSHIHKQNVSSRRTHENCGFVKILDYAEYIDGTVRTNSDTFVFKKTAH